MAEAFDAEALLAAGWRQGAVLPPALAAACREQAGGTWPEGSWLIVVSQDCDVVCPTLEKEPIVEVLIAAPLQAKKPDRQFDGGRSPRKLHINVEREGQGIVLSASVHDRFPLPRERLADVMPAWCLPEKPRRLIAEWLAKRYIRSAFPSAFDLRWRSQMKAWTTWLEHHSAMIQGVYLKLNTLDELDPKQPYLVDLLLAVPAQQRGTPGWPDRRAQLEDDLERFWSQFEPAIGFHQADVLGTDEITLARIADGYQRFDADWVSYHDDTPTTPSAIDMPGPG